MKGVNWIGVVVATIVAYLIGWVWFDVVFGAAWMAEMHMTEAQVKAMGKMPMILGFVNTLVTCVGLGLLVPRLDDSLMGGLKTGLLAAIFFAGTTAAMDYIYAGASQKLLLIDVGYMLVMYAAAGAIIGALKFGKKAA
jgi:hypothetical protein